MSRVTYVMYCGGNQTCSQHSMTPGRCHMYAPSQAL